MTTAHATGLSLILGPANSGKLGSVLEWWQARQRRMPLIVVPTGPDARSLSEEMAQRVGALVGQSPAVTFDGLVRLLTGGSLRYTGDFERSLLISHQLHLHPPRAPGFSIRFPGIAGVAGSLLEQLGDSGRSPDEIDDALSRWGSADEHSAALASDIRDLLAGYRSLRDSLGMTDRADAVRRAVEAAEGWQRPIAFYGFTSFTLGQRRLIAALARGAEVLLVFDYEPARGRGLTTPEELAWWEAIAVARTELSPQALAYDSPAVAYLERHFMDDGPRPEPPPFRDDQGGGVRFLLASGQRNEAELAAEQVVELIRSGLCPGDIAIVVRHVRPWGRLLHEVLSSCSVPCQVDERSALDDTGLGHAFLVGLRGMAEDDPDAVLEHLRSPFAGLRPERVSDLELAYLRRTRRGLEVLSESAAAPIQQALADLRRCLERRPDGTVVLLDGARELTRRMLCNAARHWSASPAGAPGDDAQAFRALDGALSDLLLHRERGALPDGVLRWEVLLPALAGMAVPGAPLGSEAAVQVLTAHRARTRRFQAVIVLGLVEGEFPARADRPSLLTDAQRERFEEVAGGIFSPVIDQEEPLFVRAVSRAWSTVFLSSRDADDGGGYASQSYYWSHCKELLAVGDDDHLHRTLADQVFAPDGAPTLRQYLRACAATGVRPHPGCSHEVAAFPAWSLGKARSELTSRQVLSELAAIRSFSPSALESYLVCPFKWFVEKIVGMDDLETVMDRRLVGQFLHKVLSDTYRELRSVGALPLTPDRLSLADRIAGARIENLLGGGECPGSPAERRLAGYELKRMASNLFSMEAGAGARMLVDTELAVGGQEGVNVEGLAIRGRIDRVDSTPEGALFIVDYKSGAVPEKRKIGTAEGLQLPLYMLALERASGRPVVGGAYLSPRKMERSGVIAAGCEGVAPAEVRACRIVDDDELEGLLGDSLQLARQAAEGITNGSIRPRTHGACPDWCGLGPVCRSRRAGGRRR